MDFPKFIVCETRRKNPLVYKRVNETISFNTRNIYFLCEMRKLSLAMHSTILDTESGDINRVGSHVVFAWIHCTDV